MGHCGLGLMRRLRAVCVGVFWVQGVVRGSLSGGLYSLDEMALTDPS